MQNLKLLFHTLDRREHIDLGSDYAMVYLESFVEEMFCVRICALFAVSKIVKVKEGFPSRSVLLSNKQIVMSRKV